MWVGQGLPLEKIAFMVLITRIPILEQQTSAHIPSWPFTGFVTLFASLGRSFPIAFRRGTVLLCCQVNSGGLSVTMTVKRQQVPST